MVKVVTDLSVVQREEMMESESCWECGGWRVMPGVLVHGFVRDGPRCPAYNSSLRNAL